jgi:hypothetical protein
LVGKRKKEGEGSVGVFIGSRDPGKEAMDVGSKLA